MIDSMQTVSDQHAAAPLPPADLVVELGAALKPIYQPLQGANYPEEAALSYSIGFDLSTVAASFGLNVEPNVSIQVTDSDRAVQLRLNGNLVPYSASMIRQLWLSVSDKGWTDSARFAFIRPGQFPDAWLSQAAEQDEKTFWIFLRQLCRAAVMALPRLLLTEAVIHSYLGADTPVTPKAARPVLALLLNKGFSLQNRRASIAAAIVADISSPHELIVQELIRTFEPASVEIRVSANYWKALTSETAPQSVTLTDVLKAGQAASDPDVGGFDAVVPGTGSMAESARQAELRKLAESGWSVSITEFMNLYFTETGIYPPQIRLVSHPDVPDGRVVIKLNDRVSLAYLGIPPDCVMLTGQITPEFAQVAVHVRQPNFNAAAALVDASMKESAQNSGMAMLSPLDYLLYLTIEFLDDKRDWLLRIDDVEFLLSRLQEAYWQKSLVQAVLSEVALSQVTLILGELAHERLPIRNLPDILSQLILYNPVQIDTQNSAVYDNRLILSHQLPASWLRDWHGYLAFLRSRMRALIRYKLADADGLLRAITLTPSLEKRLLDTLRVENGATANQEAGGESLDPLSDSECGALRDAIWTLVATENGEQRVCLQTDVNVRPLLRRLIEVEFPNVPVIAASEIDPSRPASLAGNINLRAAAGDIPLSDNETGRS